MQGQKTQANGPRRPGRHREKSIIRRSPVWIPLAREIGHLFSGLACFDDLSCITSLYDWRKLERVNGIEPSSSAWKAVALPLSYTRKCQNFWQISWSPSCCPPSGPPAGRISILLRALSFACLGSSYPSLRVRASRPSKAIGAKGRVHNNEGTLS